jgi:hypothetical protein
MKDKDQPVRYGDLLREQVELDRADLEASEALDADLAQAVIDTAERSAALAASLAEATKRSQK